MTEITKQRDVYEPQFRDYLRSLKNASVEVSSSIVYSAQSDAAISIVFNGVHELDANFWRVTKNGKQQLLSSFDHGHIYGLPSHVNAIADLKKELTDQRLSDAILDSETGDLIFEFSGKLKLTVFNFTAYEVWQIYFNGDGWFSTSFR